MHLACLRKWQRLVLVSQPTHPRFYADDPRHHTCNVCKATFTCAPPTRLELMSSFTGPELGALIQSECVIGSHQTFSEELEAQLEQLGGADANPYARSLAHWARGVYLIHTVEPAQNRFDIPLDSTAHLRAIASRLDDDLTMTIDGDALRLVAVAPPAKQRRRRTAEWRRRGRRTPNTSARRWRRTTRCRLAALPSSFASRRWRLRAAARTT